MGKLIVVCHANGFRGRRHSRRGRLILLDFHKLIRCYYESPLHQGIRTDRVVSRLVYRKPLICHPWHRGTCASGRRRPGSSDTSASGASSMVSRHFGLSLSTAAPALLLPGRASMAKAGLEPQASSPASGEVKSLK